MIQEIIISRAHDIRKSQRAICEETGIEYTALNTYLNKKKGMWFVRVQKVLDNLGLSAVGSVESSTPMTIQKAAWLEIRCRKLGIRQIADDIGVSYGMLNNFVNGNGGMHLDKVERLIDRLDIKIVAS